MPDGPCNCHNQIEQVPCTYSSLASRATAVPLGVAVALLTMLPGPVAAEIVTDRDAGGDMASFAFYEGPYRPAPEQRRNDVRGVRFVHTADRVIVRVDFFRLVAVGGNQEVRIDVFTNEGFGFGRSINLTAREDHWAGYTYMSRDQGGIVQCEVGHKIDYEANMAKVAFPRSCASNPRWVRFEIVAARTNMADDTIYLDDALRDRPMDERTGGYNIVRSERVYRGATG